MFDGGLQIRFLPREQRAIGRELLTDGIEEVTEFAELVARGQIERDAELPSTETRQAASQDVDWSQQELRKNSRDEHRDGQRRGSREQRVVQQITKLASHQQRRDADADRSEILAATLQRLAHLERLAVAGEDHSKFVERRVVNDGFEIGPFRKRAADL